MFLEPASHQPRSGSVAPASGATRVARTSRHTSARRTRTRTASEFPFCEVGGNEALGSDNGIRVVVDRLRRVPDQPLACRSARQKGFGFDGDDATRDALVEIAEEARRAHRQDPGAGRAVGDRYPEMLEALEWPLDSGQPEAAHHLASAIWRWPQTSRNRAASRERIPQEKSLSVPPSAYTPPPPRSRHPEKRRSHPGSCRPLRCPSECP